MKFLMHPAWFWLAVALIFVLAYAIPSLTHEPILNLVALVAAILLAGLALVNLIGRHRFKKQQSVKK